MNIFQQMEGWLIAIIVLVLLGAFFFFCMNGYTYITYTLLFIAGLILVNRFGGDTFKRVVAVLTGLGLIYFCVLEFMIISDAPTQKHIAKDYIIVLGAQVRGDTPSLALRHRLEGALEYMELHPECTAIVSGGKGDGENISEAECMRRWLTENGISDERIICESRSVSTMENLRFSFEIIRERGDDPDGNIAIVSSCYHLHRAKEMAKMQGAAAIGVTGRLGYPIFTLGCFIREAFGLTHLWVFGY